MPCWSHPWSALGARKRRKKRIPADHSQRRTSRSPRESADNPEPRKPLVSTGEKSPTLLWNHFTNYSCGRWARMKGFGVARPAVLLLAYLPSDTEQWFAADFHVP